jgi:hypothetical protein
MKKLLLAFALLVLFACPAQAIPASTGVHCKASANTTATSCTASVTAGNTVVLVGVDWSTALTGNHDAGGCSDDKSNVYHFVELVESTGVGGIKACIGYVTTTASTIFTWTPPGGGGFVGINVSEYSGILTTSVLSTDQQRIARVVGANASISTYPTTIADELVVAYGEWHGSGTLTCDTGYTLIDESESDAIVAFSGCYKVISATGAQTHTWVNPNLGGVQLIFTLAGVETGNTGSGAVFTGRRCINPLYGAVRNVSWSCALPIKAGNLVVVVPYAQEGDIGTTNCTGISDAASSSYTYVITVDNSGVGTKACIATVAATSELNITFAAQVGGTGFLGIAAFEISGYSGTIDQVASNTGGTANATTGTTSATTNATDLVFTFAAFTTTAATCGAGYTEWMTDGSSVTGCYKNTVAVGAQSMTYTNGANTWAAAIAALTGAPNTSGLLPWLR